jgi:hypothetical protein
MATKIKFRGRRSRRYLNVAKPSGSLHPRVQKVGPEHFGIVAVDCAKARSKWMLADFYGRILIPPTVLEHNRHGFAAAIAQIRQAIERYGLGDVIVAIERTGIYHLPVKRVFVSNQFETRIVHPLTTKQFRLPADPGNKTDDTDLFAIHRRPPTALVWLSLNSTRFTGRFACWHATARSGAEERLTAQSDSCCLMFLCQDTLASSTTSSTTQQPT